VSIRRVVLLLAVGHAALFAAIDNDWPNVKKDCDKMFHPTTADPVWKQIFACGADFFTARPAHLTVESIVPGGGFGVGPTFEADFNKDKWQQKLVATGVASIRGFWATGAEFRSTRDKFGKNNSARDRFAWDLYANARDLPLMPFYGVGSNTSLSNLVDFKERTVVAGADVFNPFSAWLAGGGVIEGIFPQIGEVTNQGVISIGDRFTEATAPGLESQPALVHYGFYIEPRRTRHKFQFDYKIGYHFYEDTSTGHYSFRRFKVDGTHIFHPIPGRDDSFLTIHNRLTLSDTSTGNTVPFYMNETLGGSDINNQPTLRGFADFRFNAPDLMLIQVQYDHRIWGPLGLMGFYDTGMVAARASDLSFADLRHSFGVGVSVWAGDRAVFRVYVGLGSGEGKHLYVGIPSF
jgi:hypothetical protein